jgi:hypothetical protein
MFGIPGKGPPVTKATVKATGENRYIITFGSNIKSKLDFDIVLEDIGECLPDDARIVDINWETKGITLETSDFQSFQRDFSRRFYYLQRIDNE